MAKSSVMTDPSFRARTWLLAFVVVALFPQSALSACTDPPGPKVNWQRCNFDGLNLRGIDLAGARLRDASFFRADLSESDLQGTRSTRAKFVNAIAEAVNFDGAKLYQADFTKADLTGASLVGADLRLARMFRTTLRQADLTDAQLREADFTQADLSGATWTDGERICAEGSIGRWQVAANGTNLLSETCQSISIRQDSRLVVPEDNEDPVPHVGPAQTL